MEILNLQNLASLVGALADAFASALVAMYYGFLSFPTGFAYGIGAVLAAFWGLSTPISYQAESIVLVGGLGKNFRERLSIIVICGAIMTILGTLGLLGSIVNYIGENILAGMMAGVGVLLAKTGIGLIKEDKYSGIAAFVVSIISFVMTGNLAYMIVFSLLAASLVHKFRKNNDEGTDFKDNNENIDGDTKFSKKLSKNLTYFKPILNSGRVWKAALALSALQIGANISYGAITSEIANTGFSADKLTIMSGLADMASALFGGAPMEAVISVTATGTHPVTLGVIFMSIMAIVLFTGLIKKATKLVPVSAAAGYLFVIGTLIVVPDNLALTLGDGSSIAGIVTLVITSISDPFLGMLAGLVSRFLGL